MGAIKFVIYSSKNPPVNTEFTKYFLNMKSRGPDDTKYLTESTINITKVNNDIIKKTLTRQEYADYKEYTFLYGFHRLCVNDLSKNGSQPFEDPILHKLHEYHDLKMRPRRRLLCNGEIFNAKELIETEKFGDKDLQSTCDVEVLLPLYIKYGLNETLKRINGDYNFIITENIETFNLKTLQAYVVRDQIGMRPLYMCKHRHSIFYMFVSELKGIPKFILEDPDYIINEMPPGTYWSFQNSIINKSNDEFIKYSDWDAYISTDTCTSVSTDPKTIENIYLNIRKLVISAIISRYNNCDIPIGILLSGGFDSSLILSVLIEYLVSMNHNFIDYPIYAFTVGSLTNDDVKCSQQVVEYLEKQYNIDIIHHIVSIETSSQVISRLDNIIYNLETYDAITIREAIPYEMLFKYIHDNTNIKILLTGEGLDELCGYKELFKSCDETFQKKSVELIKNLSKFDILRADKMAGAYGLETRHPFLDIPFVEYMLTIHPRLKRPVMYSIYNPPIEKYLIRKTFDIGDFDNLEDDHKILPPSILWRPMQGLDQAFTDLNKDIENYCKNFYTDQDFSDYLNSNVIRLDNGSTKPRTKEEMYYRKIFEKHYGSLIKVVPKFWCQLWE